MAPDKVVMISVAVGIAAAGLTWFVWEFVQNLRAALRRRSAKRTIGLSGIAESNTPHPDA